MQKYCLVILNFLRETERQKNKQPLLDSILTVPPVNLLIPNEISSTVIITSLNNDVKESKNDTILLNYEVLNYHFLTMTFSHKIFPNGFFLSVLWHTTYYVVCTTDTHDTFIHFLYENSLILFLIMVKTNSYRASSRYKIMEY